MGFTVSFQTWVFLGSIAVGALLGVVYDLFRISRIALPLPAVFILLEDFCFFLFCAVITFGYMMNTLEGQVRMFIVVGELIGFVLYYLTVGSLVMKLAQVIFGFLYGILRRLYRIFLRPVVLLVRKAVRYFQKQLSKAKAACKKQGRNAKFRLKRQQVLLYNLIKKKPGTPSASPQKTKGKERSKMKRPRRTRKSLLMRICVFGFAGYLAVTLIHLQVEIAQRQKELEEIKQQCEEQRIENKELERVLMLGSDEKYIERIAREKLGFAYPDERVLIDVSGS